MQHMQYGILLTVYITQTNIQCVAEASGSAYSSSGTSGTNVSNDLLVVDIWLKGNNALLTSP